MLGKKARNETHTDKIDSDEVAMNVRCASREPEESQMRTSKVPPKGCEKLRHLSTIGNTSRVLAKSSSVNLERCFD